MLVLFTLAGTTFLVVSSQFRKSARTAARVGLHFEPPADLADAGLSELLRGSTTNNVVTPHTLLGDKYDALQGFKARIANVAEVPETSDHFFQIQLADRNADPNLNLAGRSVVLQPSEFFTVGLGQGWDRWDAQPFRLSNVAAAYNGCELTFLNGVAAGRTVRIVGYSVNAGIPTFVVMIDKADAPVGVFPPTAAPAAFVGVDILINGRPFNGMGAGLGLTGANVDMTDEVLRPNRTPDNPNEFLDYIGGGTNESYDAIDLQNLFLAAIISDGPNGSGQIRVVPSFHRPALLNYKFNNPAGDAIPIHKILLTPFNLENPLPGSWQEAARQNLLNNGADPDALSTSGRNFPMLTDVVNGPWQVDNDGDLVPDSVWVDLGFPVRTAPDGTRYKPLFAALVTDLDGRLNVNAHGQLWHADGAQQIGVIGQMVMNRGGANVDTRTLMARGQGYGPAEISLRSIYSEAAHAILLDERYGVDNFAGLPGLDPHAELDFFDVPRFFPNARFLTNADVRSYSSPPDFQGRFTNTIGLDGMPRYEYPDGAVRPNELQDSAYELSLTEDARSAADAPFDVSELEALLRTYDIDSATLPKRLAAILRNQDPAYTLTAERLLTTDSWDLPVPNFVPPANSAQAVVDSGLGRRRTSIVDYYIARRGAGFSGAAELAQNFAPEVLMGERMNLNRPFGDGRDTNGNGIVDEHAAVPAASEAAIPEVIQTAMGNVPVDNNNNGIVGDPNEYQARQIFGRQLYTLMMTLLPLSAPNNINSPVIALDFDGDGNPTSEETAFVVAQWVANVIDFRDADAIMTPFEFDLDPFTGPDLTLDGNPATDEGGDRRLVWGTERPELLITEATAWHDRRTEDLPEDGGQGTDDDNSNFDQRLKPIGAAFIELYNPWSTSTRSPAEFYAYNGAGPQGIDLRSVGAGGSPVWRIVTVKEGDGATVNALDPDHPNPTLRPDDDDFDRAVYFISSDQGVAYPPAGDAKLCFPTTDVYNQLGPIPPQGFAVVGSSGNRFPIAGNRYESLVGRRTDAVTPEVDYADIEANQTRRIVLVAGQAVEIRNNGPGAPVIRNNVVAIPVGDSDDGPESFNVSEPRDGYEDGGNPVSYLQLFPGLTPDEHVEYALSTVALEPLDNQFAPLTELGTHQNYCRLHLQRLANPLLPFHPQSNPYLTVDSHTIDLTVFNGMASGGAEVALDSDLSTIDTEFASIERGRFELGADPNPANTGDDLPLAQSLKLWKTEMSQGNRQPVLPSPPSADVDHHFQFDLVETLGAGNAAYVQRAPDPVNGPVGFPWLAFHNRPFVSHLELMHVPASRSSRMLIDFTLASNLPPYAQAPNLADASQARSSVFGHLLNWHWSSGDSPQFARLLDYVYVPSRFVGTDVYLNPTVFAQNNGFTALRHPPFNRVSKMREPGKVNVNTIYDERVWAGVLGFINGAQPGYFDPNHRPATFEELTLIRRGFPGGSSATWALDANFPEMIANPFRAGVSARYAPPSVPNLQLNDEANATLLRGSDPASTASPPVFDRTPLQIEPYEDGRRSAYFRNDSLQRMGNLLTTRSNVYAIWVTVGFFEVDNLNRPDREMGIDSGLVKRHRSFYIVDRSRPVAYEPGTDHNLDQIIRLRRRIE